ncbi:MAG: hypothetical protein C4294_02660, partial [Nitrospiraceae bacterium]
MLHGFQGEHLCSVVDGSASLLEQAIPYLLDGLANGERCIHVAADHTPEQIEKALEERNIDVRQAVASGDLLLWTPQQYRQPGVFCERRMKEFILSVLNEALVQQYRGIRLAVEMAWANNCGVDDDALVHHHVLHVYPFPAVVDLRGVVRRAVKVVGHDVVLGRRDESGLL